MGKFINESILSKISSWAQKINKADPNSTKQATALASFLSDQNMQTKMQMVAIEQLVQSFAQALSSIKEKEARDTAINQFWNTWKDKTNQALLQNYMNKYKLVVTKK